MSTSMGPVEYVEVAGSEPAVLFFPGGHCTAAADCGWPTWSEHDKDGARALFQAMNSGAGFTLDLRQAGADRTDYRRAMQQQVTCPTLITASRHDRGVAFHHAQDLAATIPNATLRELPSPSHLFWLGPDAQHARDAVTTFLASITS